MSISVLVTLARIVLRVIVPIALTAVIYTKLASLSNQPPNKHESTNSPSSMAFECGICFETHPGVSFAKVDPCGHQYCAMCTRTYVASQIEARRYPIVCPTCIADGNRRSAGTVGEDIVHRLRLSPTLYQRWHQLGIDDITVTTQCPKCKESLVLDRREYYSALNDMISCPLPGCDGYWCKTCSKVCPRNKKHKCGGSPLLRFWRKPGRTSEMDKLIRKKRWMRCPRCKTPTEKTDGCNHMTCIVPGCRAHFCYLCGKPTDEGGGHSCSNRFGWRRAYNLPFL
ncbi:hypothetical protein BOTBODRAFT_34936 [Botryobasidium botryosum FD-172 SS1]|uniref:RBR-type E3 ubiquitin transferase n=1 Tax=Botryobasidium botryosum (strain FD-172 SS1) TaxID=930990 RepID=A0A067MJX6_BOTB1|nr:hypothetical protein BOTBODRAFT_34936 [Botryobasidium botryosum FD-172 SS1]